MLNAILHKGLGATSRNMITYSSWMQKFANDPFKSMVTVDKLNTPIVVISDGASTWNVDLDSEHTVSQALHNFFTRYKYYDLLPVLNENGVYVHSGPRVRRGASAITVQKAAARAENVAYEYALQNKTLRTLNEILSSNNVAAKLFYIPYGYFYIGNSAAVSPYADYDAAAAAKTAGDNYSNNVRNSTTTTTTTTTTTKQEKDNTFMYLLIAVLAAVVYKKFIKK